MGTILAACSGGNLASGSKDDSDPEAAIAAAVQATLTAVAPETSAMTTLVDSPVATPTPAQSRPPITLPAPIPGWQTIDKPGASKGSPDAPVLLVEYSDFQCPWCTRFFQEVMPELEPLIEAGDLRFIYKQFTALGPDSITAALASECALAQGDFWTMHDWLFESQSAWKGSGQVRARIVAAAEELGYDATALEKCIDSDEASQAVAADYRETQRFGFRGTPSFILNGRLVPGFQPAEVFAELIAVSKAEALGQTLPAGYNIAPTPPPPDTDFEDEEFAVDGDPNAPVTIVEFSDYQCPFCGRFFRETKAQLDEQYIATGKVRFVYKDFPIDNIHAQARDAALAAECAGAQDMYWDMHDRIFAGIDEWGENESAVDIFKGYAVKLGLDSNTFNECLDNRTFADEVQNDLEEGQRAGTTGTPTFFINGRKIVGAQPLAAFVQIIEEELDKAQ